MRPEIFKPASLPTAYVARHEGKLYRFFPLGWAERVELSVSPSYARHLTDPLNRCVCNDFPDIVFRQLVTGEHVSVAR